MVYRSEIEDEIEARSWRWNFLAAFMLAFFVALGLYVISLGEPHEGGITECPPLSAKISVDTC